MTKTKICSRCKKKLSINEFYKHYRNKDGLTYYCKKCGKEATKKWLRNNLVKHWATKTINGHRRYGYQVNIVSEELYKIAKQTKYCPICKVELDWKFGKGKSQNNSPSLDRMDNNQILTLNNIQIICHQCNATKRDRNMKEFIDYCKMVVNRYER